MNIALIDWKGYFDKNIYARDGLIEDTLTGDIDQEVFENLRTNIYSDLKDWMDRFNLNKIVIAFESASWRKDFFPLYKFQRKIKRKKSNVQHWDLWFEFVDRMKEEFTKFPIVQIHHPKLEADDVNAILCKHYAEQGHNIYLMCNDKDYTQMFRYYQKDYNEIYMYNTKKKAFMDCVDYRDDLYKAIIQGQSKDDIPSGLKRKLVKEDFYSKVIEEYPEFGNVHPHLRHKVINRNYELIQPIVGEYQQDPFYTEKKSLRVILGKEDKKEYKGKVDFNTEVEYMKLMGFEEWKKTIEDPSISAQIERNQTLMDFERIPLEYREWVIKEVEKYGLNKIVDGEYLYILNNLTWNGSQLSFDRMNDYKLFKRLTIKEEPIETVEF